ncbi:hypothetical protein X980_6014 [Burkholderia pseudomallei MSHR4000]|nr:hypothetical protein X980_6014 [Burkholderia pseudomallei MSHR4000]
MLIKGDVPPDNILEAWNSKKIPGKEYSEADYLPNFVGNCGHVPKWRIKAERRDRCSSS